MTIALIGNQNCGKTTLFNRLTGSRHRVGNFPGVTVEKKEGSVKKHPSITAIDLPGIYSMSPYTAEEVVTRDFLIGERVDVIVNIVDINNLERSLYLTLQLLELEKPIILALNMMDEFKGRVNTTELSNRLGITCIPISAARNKGIDKLITAIKTAKLNRFVHRYTGQTNAAVTAACQIVSANALRAGLPTIYAAVKTLENDDIVAKKLNLTVNQALQIESITEKFYDPLTRLVDNRYAFITALCAISLKKSKRTRRSPDEYLTHEILAIPIFFAIMFAVFYLTFDVIGGNLSDMCERLVVLAGEWLAAYLDSTSPMLKSLIIQGIFSGVGSVLSFLPIILTLFMFLSLLEDSGYMARIAFITDKPLRQIGLTGRSFVSMLLGFGCSVPAIMSTRTLPSDRDRKLTIMLIPFMSCSAKLPIYAVFSAAFFPNHASLVMFALYIGGVIIGILSALFLKYTLYKGASSPFILELPEYRLPSPKNVLQQMYEKSKDFVTRAFTLIFLSSLIIWLLGSLTTHLSYTTDSRQSILAALGRLCAVIFKPLGFGDWRAVTALITGLTAKEAVISTLTVLLGASPQALGAMLGSIFTTQAAVMSFLTFTLLYMPCMATLAAIKRELGIARAVGIMLYQTLIAYIFALGVYQITMIFTR